MKLKHIEVEGCIVNIRAGLIDYKGRKVTSIEILPDDHFKGENKWKLYDCINNGVAGRIMGRNIQTCQR